MTKLSLVALAVAVAAAAAGCATTTAETYPSASPAFGYPSSAYPYSNPSAVPDGSVFAPEAP